MRLKRLILKILIIGLIKMALETLVNNVSTTLTAAIGSGDTSITVASATGFPSSGDFRIIIDQEVLLVTAVSGTTFTVVRGRDSTPFVSHSNGAVVKAILTKESITNFFRRDLFQLGTYGGRPAASKDGLIYIPTNVPYIYRDNGTAWKAFGPRRKITPPVDSEFTWLNQTTATLDTSKGTIYLSAPSNSSAENCKMRYKALPTAPYTITMGFFPVFTYVPSGSANIGMFIMASDFNKFLTMAQSYTTLYNHSYNSPTVFSTFNAQGDVVMAGIGGTWFRIQDNGTNRLFQYSFDSFYWQTINTMSNTNFTTTSYCGFYINPYSLATGINVFHWEVTTP